MKKMKMKKKMMMKILPSPLEVPPIHPFLSGEGRRGLGDDDEINITPLEGERGTKGEDREGKRHISSISFHHLLIIIIILLIPPLLIFIILSKQGRGSSSSLEGEKSGRVYVLMTAVDEMEMEEGTSRSLIILRFFFFFFCCCLSSTIHT